MYSIAFGTEASPNIKRGSVCDGEEKDVPHVAALLGGTFGYRFDIPLLEKFGKGRGNIEFAALCQMRQIRYRALPIEKQQYPAFPAREFSC
jgi:hypothetical protein